MKLHAETSGETHEIEIERSGERVTARIDGREYELEVSEPEPGVYLIKRDGRVFESVVSKAAKPGGPVRVTTKSHEFEIKLTDPKRLRGSAAADAQHSGIAEITTAMPGKVVRILLEPGSEVEKGQAIVVVEAMKMQNELRSPKDGTVAQVRVAEGDTVGAGEVLATVD